MTKNAMNFYRPDIDGLRAFAVVSVILFHLNAGLFPGGFVGVDVFFVISGYLITGLVRRKATTTGFKYKEFFVRRVRRLTPALLFLTGAACVAAYFVLLPGDLVSFAKSVIAQPIAFQNMHFMIEGEYFRGADSKPLLHTWSLGVEEQFYFVWPFVIVFLSRFRRKPILWMMSSILLLSFLLSLALPVFSPKASFFLFPARAWELGVGGMLAIIEETRKETDDNSSLLRTILAGTGLTLLVGSFLWISEDMAFPGWIAIVPVVATVLLVATGSVGDSPIKRALGYKPLVFIGIISYPLYLWHWPVIVFARELGFDLANVVTSTSLMGLATVLAWVSYRYVEQPIRKRQFLVSTVSLLTVSVVLGVSLILFGVLAIRTNGFAFRYDEPARAMLTATFDTTKTNRCGLAFRITQPGAHVCQMNSGDTQTEGGVLIWGNSHAGMWAESLAALGTEYDTSVYLNARNCRATTDSAFCGEPTQRSVLSFVESQRLEHVVLASTWYGAYDIVDSEFEAELENVVASLLTLGVEVWLVVDVPAAPSFDPEAQYKRSPEAPVLGTMPMHDHVAQQQAAEAAFFGRLATSPRVHVIDPTDAFCFDDLCHGGRDNEVWYHDSNHLTLTGVSQAISLFAPIFER